MMLNAKAIEIYSPTEDGKTERRKDEPDEWYKPLKVVCQNGQQGRPVFLV